jgi:hypothetical protein
MPGDTVSTTNEIVSGPNVSRVKSVAGAPVAVVLNALQANLYGFHVYGTAAAASARFLKFYDKAGAVVVGTDVPKFTIPLVSTTGYAAVADMDFDAGVPFKNGLQYALTGGVADSDTTVCVADDVHGVILWK